MIFRLNFVTNVLSDDACFEWIDKNIVQTPTTVLRTLKQNLLGSANFPTLEQYKNEEKTFRSLYGAEENRAAVLAVISSLKK